MDYLHLTCTQVLAPQKLVPEVLVSRVWAPIMLEILDLEPGAHSHGPSDSGTRTAGVGLATISTYS